MVVEAAVPLVELAVLVDDRQAEQADLQLDAGLRFHLCEPSRRDPSERAGRVDIDDGGVRADLFHGSYTTFRGSQSHRGLRGAIVGRWRGIRPDLDPTPMLVIARIARLAALTDDLLRPPFAAVGITNGDFDLLAALRRQDPPHEANPGELAHAMLVTTGATAKRTDRLERQGYVTRRTSDLDRGRIVALTPAGLGLVDELFAVHLANEASILAHRTRRSATSSPSSWVPSPPAWKNLSMSEFVRRRAIPDVAVPAVLASCRSWPLLAGIRVRIRHGLRLTHHTAQVIAHRVPMNRCQRQRAPGLRARVH